MSEEEYAKMRGLDKKVSKEDIVLRDNSVLLFGTMDVLKWIAFELGEKGFDLRIACDKSATAIDIFGIPGKNVDIIEVSEESNDEVLANAVNGAQAIGIYRFLHHAYLSDSDCHHPRFLHSAIKFFAEISTLSPMFSWSMGKRKLKSRQGSLK
jgi:hypothetical protein